MLLQGTYPKPMDPLTDMYEKNQTYLERIGKRDVNLAMKP